MRTQSTIDLIAAALTRWKITNPLVQTAILTRVKEESNFLPKNELSYRNTPNARLRFIFGSRLANYTDQQLDELKQNDVKFFDAVYGYLSKLGRDNGNTTVGDGFKYRGRGFNQITFKNNYERFGRLIGQPLVQNPDLLNQMPIAAEALAAFFAESFRVAAANGAMQRKIGIANPAQVADKETAVRLVLQTNAGWGNNIDQGFLAAELAKMKSNFDDFVRLIKTNPGTSAASIIGLGFLFFLAYKIFNKKKKQKNG